MTEKYKVGTIVKTKTAQGVIVFNSHVPSSVCIVWKGHEEVSNYDESWLDRNTVVMKGGKA